MLIFSFEANSALSCQNGLFFVFYLIASFAAAILKKIFLPWIYQNLLASVFTERPRFTQEIFSKLVRKVAVTWPWCDAAIIKKWNFFNVAQDLRLLISMYVSRGSLLDFFWKSFFACLYFDFRPCILIVFFHEDWRC